LSKELGFVFIPPKTKKVYYIVRKRNDNYYIYDLSKHGLKPFINELNRELRDLYVEIGGKELRLFKIPPYSKLLDTFIDIAKKLPNIERGDKPEFVVFVVKHRDQVVNFILDLRGLDKEINDIPLAWNHEEAGKGFPETYCFVIGYRDVLKHIAQIGEDEESIEGVAPGKVSKRKVSCPLLKVAREASNQEIITKYLAKICKRFHRCKSLEDNRGFYRMRGTDVLDYIIQTRSALQYTFMPKSTPSEKYSVSAIIDTKKYSKADIILELQGFKLELRRYPMIYVGTFRYDDNFEFKSTISNTKAIEFNIDSRWLIFHYIYYMLRDPYLKLSTTLKYMLIDKANAFIPEPARALYYDPRLSISSLRRILEEYLSKPEKLSSDLNEYIRKIENITFNDKKLISLIETTALHSFAHILYLAFLQMFEADEDEIGFIIEKEYEETAKDEYNVYPFDEFLDPRLHRYKVIVYEKADAGLGYMDLKLRDLMDNLFSVFKTFKKSYEKITQDITVYRNNIYNYYYKNILQTIATRKYSNLENLIKELEELNKAILTINEQKGLKDYTVLPGWLIRYGINIDRYALSSDEKSFIESTIWLILDSLYDLYWDASPYDLVIKQECVYPDLIRYFTLSRTYAAYLISDLIENYNSPYFVASPLTKKAGEIFNEIKHGSSEHAFYTPWIDEHGKRLIDDIIYHPSTQSIYVVVRELEDREINIEKAKLIVLKKVFSAPLHAKLYVNSSGEVIITSQNLLRASLKGNIENYSYFIDHVLAKSVLAFSNILFNTALEGERS